MMSAKKLLEMVELSESIGDDYLAFERSDAPEWAKNFLRHAVRQPEHAQAGVWLQKIADILQQKGTVTQQDVQVGQQDAKASSDNAPAPTAAPITPQANSFHSPTSAPAQDKTAARAGAAQGLTPITPQAPQIPTDKLGRFDNTLGTGGSDISNQFDLGDDGTGSEAQNLLQQAPQSLPTKNNRPAVVKPDVAAASAAALSRIAQDPATPKWMQQAINVAPKDNPKGTSKWFEWLKDMAEDPNTTHDDFNNAMARSPNWVKQVALAAQKDGKNTDETAKLLDQLSYFYGHLQTTVPAAQQARADKNAPKRQQDPNLRNALNKQLKQPLPPRNDIGGQP